MRFAPNEDQTAFLAVLDQMMEAPETAWKASQDWSRFALSAELDRMLQDNGFFDCAREPTLGLTAAAAMTYRVARLPVLVECAASALLRSIWSPDLPRPVAVIDVEAGQAAPFLPEARSVIRLDGGRILAATLEAGQVDTVDSLYAYPVGRLKPDADIEWRDLPGEVEEARAVWRAAVAAELSGCLKGGLDAVVAHVGQRHQFGRPLGSFQAIQHRLANAATKIDAAYWLALRAAQTRSTMDATLALGFVQEASTRIVLDLHQFMGAMGLTLEHPLHRWTYRARLLRSSMGGPTGNFRDFFALKWSNP